ncbi:hypothetical protein C8R43DRAFT_1135694 [Mycena crocata]|nr:hypothetical protein C8R43DRAFT_1135694 [Mycena crocata]
MVSGSDNDRTAAQPQVEAETRAITVDTDKAEGLASITLPLNPELWDEVQNQLEYLNLSSSQELIRRIQLHIFCLYNKDITVYTDPGRLSTLVPSFWLARCGTQTDWDFQPVVIFECALSRPSEAVKFRVEQWLKHPSVELVIVVDVQQDPYSAPAPSLLATTLTSLVNMAQINAMGFPALSPIRFKGHDWFRRIDSITLGLYARPDEQDTLDGVVYEEFDITPVSSDGIASTNALAERPGLCGARHSEDHTGGHWA